MTAPVLNVNSDSYFIRIGWLNRMRLISPFDGAAKVMRSNAQPTQAEHLPFLGSYFLGENAGPDGDGNAAEPRFEVTLKLGFSWVILNNDSEQAEDMLDAASWSFMKMLHDPAWKNLGPPEDPEAIRIESIPAYSIERHYGKLNNETPIAELRIELTVFHRTFFEAIISDAFEVFHSTTEQAHMDPAEVKPITVLLNLPQ